jgi:hypothetical protein
MGRQIRFYFVEQDEGGFLEFLNKEDIIYLRRDHSEERAYRVYDEFQLNPRTEASHSQTLVCRTCDIDRLRFLPRRRSDMYFIDCGRSPVIEFSRSGFHAEAGILVSGRLWYEHKYWDKDAQGNAVVVAKGEDLKKLYERLARWIKKHGKRLPNGNYIAPHAADLHAQGAELSP